MKRLYIYLIFSTYIFASELNLEDIIGKFNEKSPFIKEYQLEIEKFQKEEVGLKKNRNRKVDYRGEVFKESSTDREIRRNYDDVEKGQLNLYYDIFYYETLYEFEDSGYYREGGSGLKESRIGIRKPLNDLIYSEKDYEKNYTKIKEEIVKNSLIFEYLNKAEEIIDFYGKILSLQQSIEIDKESLVEYNELYKIAVKKIEVGEGLQLEVDYLKAEAMEVEERLNYSDNLKKIKISKLGKDIGNYLESDKNLKLFPEKQETKVRVRVNDYDLKGAKKEILMIKEKVKLKKRNEQAELTLGGDYDLERELWSMRVSLDGSIFDYKLDSSLGESDAKILSEKTSYLEEIKESELRTLKEDHSYLKNNLKIKELKKENREKTVVIAAEMYKMGYITAKKFIEEKIDAREAKLEYLEVLNKLGAFEYKMYLRERVARGNLNFK